MCNNKCALAIEPMAKSAPDGPKWVTMALTKPQAELIDAMCRQEILDAPEACEVNHHFKALFRRVQILLTQF